MPVNPGKRSSVSCRSCRRRKVKCDRRFPRCLVCEQTSQDCSYPPGRSKPGPKIGSRRLREQNANSDDAHNGRTQNPGPDAASENQSSFSPVERQDRSPSSEGDEANMRRASDLSFILHPAHETPNSNAGRVSGDMQNSAAMTEACLALGLSYASLERLVATCFDNMVAINLFHEPSFYEMLRGITSTAQVCALLTALRSFAVRFDLDLDEHVETRLGDSQSNANEHAAYYLDLTAGYINEALNECGDYTPPLCILQACIISTHCQLSQGVLGKAWRSLGTCARLAYEMNLHLVDVGASSGSSAAETHPAQWCEDEGKRRAWWAVWEMDVFATTIRRTPTAIDWSQIDTLLPVENRYWFERKPRPSCFLEMDPVCRWKTLQRSGNESPKAWFIVINSLMKDAQRISSPRGVPSASTDYSNDCRPDSMNAARRRLEVIENAVQCYRLALPSHLKYHNQYLGFEPRAPGQNKRQDHCSIYNIYMMTQLARLMIHRFDAFGERPRVAISSHDLDASTDSRDWTESLAIKQYFEAADDLLIIVRRSCDDHIRYINPFLSSTIWLASAVLLVRSQFCRPETTRPVIKSRYEVMHLTYRKCVDFWGIRATVQQNLGDLERRLEACRQPDSFQQEIPKTLRAPSVTRGRGGRNNNTRQPPHPRRLSSRGRGVDDPDSPASHMSSPGSVNAGRESAQLPPSPPSSHGFQHAAWPSNGQGELAIGGFPDVPLDPMHLAPRQQMDSHPAASNLAAQSPAELVDPLISRHTTQLNAPLAQNTQDPASIGVDFDWAYPRLPTDLHDMLSGLFTA